MNNSKENTYTHTHGHTNIYKYKSYKLVVSSNEMG